jgi:hypothetical protein
MNGYSANSLTDDIAQIADITADGLMTKLRYSSDAMAATTHGLSRAKNFYSHLLEGTSQSMRMGLFSRNLAYEQWKLKKAGQPVTLSRAQMHRIANNARNIAVDPTKRGSSETLNKVMSAVPYGNIILQSSAHLAGQTMLSRSAMSVVGTAMLGLWFSRNQMSEEARDYVENGQPAYKDIAFLTFEIPHDGEPFVPSQHLFRIPLGPELGTLLHGASALFDGMMYALGDEYRGDAASGTLDRLWEVAADTLNFPVPPILNIAATAGGLGQIQPGAAIDGRELFQQPRDYGNGMEGFRGIGLDEGVVSDRLWNMVYSALGTFGRTVMDSAEVIDTGMNKYDMNFRDAADHAAGAFFHDALARSPVGTLFTSAIAPPTPGTRLSGKAYELQDSMERISAMARMAMTKDTGDHMDADIPYSRAITVMPDKLTDPLLQQQAVQVRSYMLSGNNADAIDRIAQLRRSYYQTKSNVIANRDAVNTILSTIDKQMQDNYSIVLDRYGEFEQRMRETFQDPSWTLSTFIDAAEQDLINN